MPASSTIIGPVHMNGRIYDPLLGRFLSADLVVQNPGDLQAFNRYSYVWNNPLRYTDPTGFETEEEKRIREQKKQQPTNTQRVDQEKVKAKKVDPSKAPATTETQVIQTQGGTTVTINPVVVNKPVYVKEFSRKAKDGAQGITYATTEVKPDENSKYVTADGTEAYRAADITVTVNVEILEEYKGDSGIVKLENQHVDDLKTYISSGLAKDIENPNFPVSLGEKPLHAATDVFDEPKNFRNATNYRLKQAEQRSSDFWDSSKAIPGVRDALDGGTSYHNEITTTSSAGTRLERSSISSPQPSRKTLGAHLDGLRRGTYGYTADKQ